ncbi:MAG: DUF4835 family protein [Bacteroidales bacterium]|nr:DUF4835 family protein [Bacteroidales bacterium]
MLNRVKILVFLLLLGQIVNAQELECNVSVMSQQIQGSNKQVFDTMRKALYEFVNNTKWTDHVYKDEERIRCSMMFNITNQISSDEFSGTLQIQSNRPVYNSSYETNLFNYRDNDIHFKYVEFEPLEFNEQAHTSNLVAIVAYYVNIILGLDYDSFSLEGGTLFFQRAETIVSNAQNAPESGWKAFEGTRNRYWLVENLLNDKYSVMRTCFYNYHRLGLDRMSGVVDEGRGQIGEALINLRPAYRENPSAMIWSIFFTAKADEITNIFTEAFPDERSRVVQVLKEIDPANTSKWDKINKGSGI